MFARKFKYVIIADLYPRVCSEAETHRDLAGGLKATSAGFAELSIQPNVGPDGADVDFNVQCWGESVSLNIKSNAVKDAVLLRRMFCESY